MLISFHHFRYYVAEGVRIYNQDTWRQVTEGHGGSLVEVYIKEIVSISRCTPVLRKVAIAAAYCLAVTSSFWSQKFKILYTDRFTSGGSRISRKEGAHLVGGRVPTPGAATFRKICMSKRKNLDPKGACARHAP